MNIINNHITDASSPTCFSKKRNFANRKKLVQKVSNIKTPTKFDLDLNMEIEEDLNFTQFYQNENTFNQKDNCVNHGLKNIFKDINITIINEFTIESDSSANTYLEDSEDSTNSGTSSYALYSNNDNASVPVKRNMLKKRFESLNVNTQNKKHKDSIIPLSPEWFGYRKNTVLQKTKSPLMKTKKQYINSPI